MYEPPPPAPRPSRRISALLIAVLVAAALGCIAFSLWFLTVPPVVVTP